MTRISKKKLKSDVLEAVVMQLLESIVYARTKREASILVNELLTETERVMLAKRLASIAMLARGYSFSQIETLLEISPDTVSRMWRRMRLVEYPHLVKHLRLNPKKFEGETFLDVLEKILSAGMPPRGRGRWDAFKRMARSTEYPD